MYPSSIVLWYSVLLLVASSSESQRNSTNGDEQSDNSTMQYDRNDEMKPTRCNSSENSIKNDNEMQYESCINSTKNDRNDDESRGHIKNHEENNQTAIESHTDSTEIDNSTLQEDNEALTTTEDDSNVDFTDLLQEIDVSLDSIIPYNECNDTVTCIQLCCNLNHNLTVYGRCVFAGQGDYYFPDMYENSEYKINNSIYLTVRDPCVEQGLHRRKLLNLDMYWFLSNGSLYNNVPEDYISPNDYCFAILTEDSYDAIICTNSTQLPIYESVCVLVSLPFLLLTFVVYSIIPQLQNMHGYTLRAHVASLFITYAIIYFGQQTSGLGEKTYCLPLAYIFNFFFLASFFWLNVTCFDIWWTFKGLWSSQTNTKQDKKKFIIYSIYAWGIPFILNVIYAIIDHFPIENFTQPGMCRSRFWFDADEAYTIYFYIPMGITIISNICFFIATTATIKYQNLHTAQELKASGSKRHNENKQRFSMYLKLFIIMGISWLMEIITWFINTDLAPEIIWYPTDIINGLQGLIIFIMFVCTKKMKHLLLKRFGGKSCGPFCKIPTYDSTVSNTTSISTSASKTVSMQGSVSLVNTEQQF